MSCGCVQKATSSSQLFTDLQFNLNVLLKKQPACSLAQEIAKKVHKFPKIYLETLWIQIQDLLSQLLQEGPLPLCEAA